jgi:hypothetical protein
MSLSNFKGTSEITLLPNDVIPYDFEFTICSSAKANDGFTPFGTTISSVDVTGYNDKNEDVTGDLIDGIPSELNNIVTVTLQYPGTDGRYRLNFVVTLNTGSVKEANFPLIRAVSI